MLKLDAIAGFVAVAESRSISAAARRLRLSKSVVSARLADLEQTLGTSLLHRTTRKLSLTEDGAAFLERATRILHEVEAATSELAERRGELVGPLRISAPVTFGRMHLGPALYPLLARHPRLELTLELDDRRVDAAADGYDAVVRHGVLDDSRLVAWHLAPSQRLLVASPDYLARHGTPHDLETLGRHRGIFYLNRGAADWRLQAPDGPVSVQAATALRVNNGDLSRDAAIAGLGIALLPSFIVGDALLAGSLHRIDVGALPAPESLYVASPVGRRASAKLRALVDCLRQAIGDPPYWDAFRRIDAPSS
ncbi:LysR family transcriptional regulator [Chitiniphilus purpureus]|uniref:LysR family transcriptional regulator n=1 Tax=Chitiniphilus purpureus TaxID=2981137 RepID=A0ABY6DM08_9NEIS|nr:LysR family transcriptional regulator [Chitiniphilus sp. CD1]UXY14516.1 LysR family transcriptional regulator [Chitiniphilus sp. CD1]